MREIKFRAWDSLKNRMIDDYCSMNSDNQFEAYDLTNDTYYEIKAVMQFTGLLDKNGKEIYEGDILKVTSNLVRLSDDRKTGKLSIVLGIVEWIEDGWGITKVKNIQNYPSVLPKTHKGLRITANYAEVIGNIYENPELVKG